MAQLLCAAHLKPCAIRATRLDELCQYVPGPNNSVTTSALIRFDTESDIEEGEEIIQRNGCGEICLNIKDKDELKRLNVELELCLRDIELIEILTGSEVVLNEDGDTIGSCTVLGPQNCTGAFLEIWVKVGSSSGKCVATEDGDAIPWVRYIYPCARFTVQGNTFENGLNNLVLTGTVEPIPAPLDGPFSDWPGAEDIDPNTLECWAYDLAGPPATACGYGEDVPETANDDDPLGREEAPAPARTPAAANAGAGDDA